MRVLIVGLGSIARKHIAALRSLDPGVELIALRSGASSAPVEGVRSIYSLSELHERPDFAMITNPTALHARTLEMLLPLNVPLFIEKPLFSESGHEELLEQVRSKGLITYVACNMRFMSLLQYLRKFVKDLRVNEVQVYCGSYLPSWRPGTPWREGYSARPELGGGVHLDLIHELDYMYWIFGAPQKVHKLLRHVSSLDIEAVDYANYTLEYEGFTASVILNYYRRDYKRTVEVVADEGTFLADLEAGTLTDDKGSELFSSNETDPEVYCAQMKYFLSLLEGKTLPSNDIFEASEVLKLCLE